MRNNSDLKNFLSELNIKDSLNVEEDLGNGYVRLKISEAERRQALQDINSVEDIIVEMIRNSRDAGSRNIFIGTKKIEDKRRKIYFIDDGDGIPPNLQNLIFESRVTSKLENGIKDPYGFHGRGMALFSIKLNVDDIRIIFSEKLKGASFYIDIDLIKIPEKKDQSLMPQIIKTDGNLNIIGGVNNIIKTIIEFQLQNREINFFFGSPTRILSTMREISRKDCKKNNYPKFDEWEKLSKFIQKNNIKVTEIPMLTDNYNVMEIISKNIFNMDISQRGIQRILYNEIKALEPLEIDSDNAPENPLAINSDIEKERKIPDKNVMLYDESKLAGRFKDGEIRCIIKAAEDKIKELGDKYFVTTGENIEFKKANNIIKLSIELKQKE
ncbi:MAG: ATP-binding protein [Actinomycetota bacterium]|nr:ATP-binding protein [Actinomycetota bacterium]